MLDGTSSYSMLFHPILIVAMVKESTYPATAQYKREGWQCSVACVKRARRVESKSPKGPKTSRSEKC